VCLLFLLASLGRYVSPWVALGSVGHLFLSSVVSLGFLVVYVVACVK
jgi:hypothetical protein